MINTQQKRQNLSTLNLFFNIPLSDTLPPPTLLLQQQDDVWRLQCTGSPFYPGAEFALYLADSDGERPVATKNAGEFSHQVMFPVLVQDNPLALYQCQYSVHLRGRLRTSERSLQLAVAKGMCVLFTVCFSFFAMELRSDLCLFPFHPGGNSNLTSGKVAIPIQV